MCIFHRAPSSKGAWVLDPRSSADIAQALTRAPQLRSDCAGVPVCFWPILLKNAKMHSLQFLARLHCNRQFARQIVATFVRTGLVARNKKLHGPPRPGKERRVCGPVIFRAAPEREFF